MISSASCSRRSPRGYAHRASRRRTIAAPARWSADRVNAWLSNSSKKLPVLGSNRWNQPNISLTLDLRATVTSIPVRRTAFLNSDARKSG